VKKYQSGVHAKNSLPPQCKKYGQAEMQNIPLGLNAEIAIRSKYEIRYCV
jgi:hypothetical protein